MAINNPEPMPLGEPAMGEPQGMPQDFGDNIDNEEMSSDNENIGDDSEINDIFSKLDIEKQAAVIKYAKSMVGEQKSYGSEMPCEDEIVTEITNNILDDKNKPNNGEDDKIRNKKVTKDNPFITKDFNKVDEK